MTNLNSEYNKKPFWARDESEDLIKNYITESSLVRRGANFDMQKCMLEGKALIIEGHHIIPNLYLNNVNEEICIYTPDPEEAQKVILFRFINLRKKTEKKMYVLKCRN